MNAYNPAAREARPRLGALRGGRRLVTAAAVLAPVLWVAGCVPPAYRVPEPTPQEIAHVRPAEVEKQPLPPLPAQGEYVVQPGDTLWSIAQRFQLESWSVLLELNPGIDPKDLKPGSRLALPNPNNDV